MSSVQDSVLHSLLCSLNCGDAYAFYRIDQLLNPDVKRIVRSELLNIIPREDKRLREFFDGMALALEAIGAHDFIAALRRDESKCRSPRFDWTNYVLSMTIRGSCETREPGFYDGFEGPKPFGRLRGGITFDVLYRQGGFLNCDGDTMMMARCYRARPGRAECGDLAVYYSNAPTVLDAALHWLLEVVRDAEGARRLFRRFPGAVDRRWAARVYREDEDMLCELLQS